MFIRKSSLHLSIGILSILAVLFTGCLSPKTKDKVPTLLRTTDATQADLMADVNRFARVESLRAKMYLKFEDNSFAEFGNKDVYREADGEVVVQRPGKILMTVKIPVIKTDVAKMTSDGEKFRVAVLLNSDGGKWRKFVMGTNSADYSKLQKNLDQSNDADKTVKQNVNAFANLRPQHFTDAMLVRPTDGEHAYAVSTIFQIEEDVTADKKSPLRKVNRGYYLLDEYRRSENGDLSITRRFWFDRVGGIRLARQQIFGNKAEIESDIVYGAEGNLTDTGEYNRLPLQILVTRPQEKYAMRLTYQTPEDVQIGKKFPDAAFVLENSWGLEEIDLDKRLREVMAQKPKPALNSNSALRLH